MGRIILIILNVLAFTAMTISFASAFEESKGNPPRDMIEHHDQDGDNKVSRDEFPGPDEHFTRIDLDGDGFINQDEARQAPRPDRRGGRVPRRFLDDDADGDGLVSQTEFSGPADHFERMDSNGDGFIEESEARQGPPGMTQQE
ncbi:MAG: hypothetical protein GY864_15080 [Desulfobacterales bacterium]|nr:hypothetical protein [Desulfobacterales bacterium]